jgi:hypothetical protein
VKIAINLPKTSLISGSTKPAGMIIISSKAFVGEIIDVVDVVAGGQEGDLPN